MCLSSVVGFLIKDRADTSLLMASTLVVNSTVLALLPNSGNVAVFGCLYLISGGCTGMLYFGKYLVSGWVELHVAIFVTCDINFIWEGSPK